MAKRVVVFLKDGVIASEDMDQAAAQAEFDRVLAEEPGSGFAGRIIKVGKQAAFKSGDFSRMEIQDAPSGAFVA